MLHRVIVGADQEVTDDDFNRFGLWPQEGDVAIVRDFLLAGRGFTGFGVTAPTLTGIEVAAGRYYEAGAMYGTDAATPLSVSAFVPFVAGQKVIVTLLAQGREDDDFEEARNNEREVPTSSGGTTVQRVPDVKARAKTCEAILALVPGATSSIPQRPPVPLNAIAVADILIGTGGVETITRRTENEVPELDELVRAFAAQEGQIAEISETVAGLRNDIAALGRLIAGLASTDIIQAVTADIGRLKDKLAIPDTASPYGADHFLDETESDPDNVDYKARIEEGIRFPYANFWQGPIALYNANDPNFMHAAQGLICPKYTALDGILVSKQAGTLPLGGTTYQTMQLGQLTMSRTVTRYGDYFTVCANSTWWRSGRYDPGTGVFSIGGLTYQFSGIVGDFDFTGHEMIRLRRFWEDSVQEPYDAYVPVTSTIQGVLKAQSFIQSQDRWVPAVKLGIVSWSAGAEITATLVQCRDDGTPDPTRMLQRVTLAAAQFKAFPAEWTRFVFAKPTFATKSVGLYAVLFATTGDVTVAYAEGQQFLGGTLFDSTDGTFFAGDLTRDLCFGVEFCRFDITRLPVLLQGLNLDGGIHDIGIKAGMIVPTNADATWQLQVGGTWRDVAAPAEGADTLFGAGVTPFYGFRVNLNGNEWAMPVIDMAATEVTVFRADDDYDHISDVETMPTGFHATTVKVTATLGAWDPARHTAVAKLRYGAGYASIKSHTAVVTKAVVNRSDAVDMVWTFTFTSPGIDSFKIELIGTTNNARVTYHVEERLHSCT